MDLLGTSINAAVVACCRSVFWHGSPGAASTRLDRRIDRLETRLVGTETRISNSGRIDGWSLTDDGLDSRLGSRIDGLDSRFDRLESRFDRRFDALQSSMDAMRSDLTQVALAVGVRPRAQND